MAGRLVKKALPRFVDEHNGFALLKLKTPFTFHAAGKVVNGDTPAVRAVTADGQYELVVLVTVPLAPKLQQELTTKIAIDMARRLTEGKISKVQYMQRPDNLSCYQVHFEGKEGGGM